MVWYGASSPSEQGGGFGGGPMSFYFYNEHEAQIGEILRII